MSIKTLIPTALSALAACVAVSDASAQGPLPPVPVPVENPITPQKAVLGKILFWEEQLSSDNTMSCGTCHQPSAGGSDRRIGRHAGLDGRFNTADDKFGSPGMRLAANDGSFASDPMFGHAAQVTRRTAQPVTDAAYSPRQFWDGRAVGRFLDPVTGQVRIADGGGLESQSIQPVLADDEMAHSGRTWSEITTKLQNAKPMALATNLPGDVAAALTASPTFPDLFRDAFGDSTITPTRIAFAIATYERTLVSNQTPYDRFAAGNPNALTLQQRNGLNAFQRSVCSQCHSGPSFSDFSFRNVGVRPVAEDTGRQEVTNNLRDRGRFKVPSLRNVGLRTRFMHDGQRTNLGQVLDFYIRRNGQISFADNRDRLLDNPPRIDPRMRADIIEFLQNGLTDPRVANQTAPFDRPTLRSDRAPNRVFGFGLGGGPLPVPNVISQSPAFVGASDFKLGLSNVPGGSLGALAFSAATLEPFQFTLGLPLNVDFNQVLSFDTIALAGTGTSDGYGTKLLPIPNAPALRGAVLAVQAFVVDSRAPLGAVASRGYEFVIE